MRIIIAGILSIGLVAWAPGSWAESPTDKLSVCLVDSLNGKERKTFAKWVFFAMAAHPEITDYSKVKKSDVRKSSKALGGVFTRLLTEDCPNELVAANASNPLALQKAFELVGQVAMQELMSNDEVMTIMSGFAEYADLQKINTILDKK